MITCSFDDGDFSINEVRRWGKGQLMELVTVLAAQLDQLTQEADNLADPTKYDALHDVIRRKRRQSQYAYSRLAQIKDTNRVRSTQRYQRAKIAKEDRRAVFLRYFYEYAQQELEREDFKAICQMAHGKLQRRLHSLGLAKSPSANEAPHE